jgi:hypothetical protein
VNDHLHAQTALPHRQEPLAPTMYEATWDPQLVWLLCNIGNLSSLPGITPFPSHTLSLVKYKIKFLPRQRMLLIPNQVGNNENNPFINGNSNLMQTQTYFITESFTSALKHSRASRP